MSHIKDFTLLFTMNRMSPRLDMELWGLLLKNGSQFCFGLDTKTFFLRLNFDILSTMNLKYEKKQSNGKVLNAIMWYLWKGQKEGKFPYVYSPLWGSFFSIFSSLMHSMTRRYSFHGLGHLDFLTHLHPPKFHTDFWARVEKGHPWRMALFVELGKGRKKEMQYANSQL